MKKFKFLFILFYFSLFGCQFLEKSDLINRFAKKKMADRAKPQEKQNWVNIKKQKGSFTERMNRIDQFIEDNKGKETVLPAYMLKAKILFQNKKARQACSIYHELINSSFDYKGRWKAYQESAQCYFKEGKILLAVETLERLIQHPKELFSNKKQAVQLQWSFLKNQKALISLKLKSLSHLIQFSSGLTKQQAWFNKAKKIIDDMSFSKLVIYANQASIFGELEPYLLYKAGQYFLKNKKFKKAEKYFKKSLSTSLSPPLKMEVKQLLSLMKKISQVNPYLIGAVIPLSGRRKTLGEKILRGLYLGLSMNQDSPWQILVLDSQSHPEVVRTHINDLFYKRHVIGLIGGLTSETAEVMALKAEEFAIPAVIFSQKQDITKGRGFVFQNAVTARHLLIPLIKEVRHNLKIQKTAVLYPDDPYGRDYFSLFAELFKKEGGVVTEIEKYKPGEVDFKRAVKNLLHLNIKNREGEFEKLKAERLKKKASARSLKLTPENILPAQKDFSAVFIPDSLDSLTSIRNHFRYFGITDIYFLGTNLWQKKGIKRKDFPLLFVNLPEKDNQMMKKSDFYKYFVKSYNYPPGHFEQRAYNTALFFKQALEKNIKTRLSLQKELKNLKNFQGAYYSLSLSKDRVFEYPIEVYKFLSHKVQ